MFKYKPLKFFLDKYGNNLFGEFYFFGQICSLSHYHLSIIIFATIKISDNFQKGRYFRAEVLLDNTGLFDYKNKVLYCGDKQITALDLSNLAKYSYTQVTPGGQMRTWYLLGDGYIFYTSECDRLKKYVKQVDRSRLVKLGKVY